MAKNYLINLFSTNQATPSSLSTIHGFPGLDLTNINALCVDVMIIEIQRAFFDIDGLKTPSPDGFQVIFFQKHWRTLGHQVSEFILIVFQSEMSVGMVNQTFLVLIPKVQHPKSIVQFRPIIYVIPFIRLLLK